MADFCKQCSLEYFGKDCRDLADLGPCYPAICEGCGVILVNLEGECISCDLKIGEFGHGGKNEKSKN